MVGLDRSCVVPRYR